MAAVAKHEAYVFQYEDFLHALFEARPFDALDAFVGENGETGTTLTEMVARNKNPLEAASDESSFSGASVSLPSVAPAIAQGFWPGSKAKRTQVPRAAIRFSKTYRTRSRCRFCSERTCPGPTAVELDRLPR